MTGVNSERAMVVNSWKALEWYPGACRCPPTWNKETWPPSPLAPPFRRENYGPGQRYGWGGGVPPRTGNMHKNFPKSMRHFSGSAVCE